MMTKLKVAIVGIKGLPPRYGGFETLANNLVKKLGNEFDFIIYNSKGHFFNKKYFNAKIINIPLPANGALGLLYDSIALFHAWIKSDAILYLGPGVGWLLVVNKLFKKKIITNHGGLNEWEREKLNFLQKRYAYFNHKYACCFSDINVVDNTRLKKSLYLNFGVNSIVIRYGGDHVLKKGIKQHLYSTYPFLKSKYVVSISRAQIDNKLHVILKAFSLLPTYRLVLISNWNESQYGKKLKKRYISYSNIIMLLLLSSN